MEDLRCPISSCTSSGSSRAALTDRISRAQGASGMIGHAGNNLSSGALVVLQILRCPACKCEARF